MSTDFLPYRERTGPQHRVYVIRVERVDETVTWDYYVGYTNLYLRERWDRYQDLTGSVSTSFRRGQVRAVEYAYDLMDGWGPYETREQGLQAEGDLARTLHRAGYAVYSDRMKH